MRMTTAQPPARELDVGDRIHIQQGHRSIPTLLAHVGTIIEVFRAPHGSCLVRLDGDPDRLREWFFYSDEVATGDA